MRRRKLQVGTVPGGFRFWLESQGLAKDTIRNYSTAVGIWAGWCAEHGFPRDNPQRADLREYIGYLLQIRARSNVELLKIGLRRYFTYLIDEGRYEGPNPVTNLTIKKRETEPTEPFTKEELTRMLLACRNHQERAIFLLLMGGGLRRGEIYGITRDDVNLETGTIRVTGKTGPRYNKPGRFVLEAVVSAMEFDEHLCPQTNKDVIWRIVRALAKRAGIRGRVYPHRFRHSFAVHFLEAGGTLENLMHVLGHKRLDMSLWYARAGAKRRALDSQEAINIAETMLDLRPHPLLLNEPQAS